GQLRACLFFFSSRRRHTRSKRDWSSDVCSSDLAYIVGHQPTVSEVIGHLNPAGGVPIGFRPSSIAVFDLDSWDLEPGEYPAPQIDRKSVVEGKGDDSRGDRASHRTPEEQDR